MSDRRRSVRGYSLERWPLRGQYGWYLLKKAACLAVVVLLALLAYARMPHERPWLSMAVPAVIAVAGFWISGRIRMRPAAADPVERGHDGD